MGLLAYNSAKVVCMFKRGPGPKFTVEPVHEMPVTWARKGTDSHILCLIRSCYFRSQEIKVQQEIQRQCNSQAANEGIG